MSCELQAVALDGEVHDGTTLGCLVGLGRQQRRHRELVLLDAHDRQEGARHPVAVGDRAGLVEQEGAHVAGGLDGSARHGQDVALHESVHAGDADGRQQRADGGRDQADQEGDEHDDRLRQTRVGRVGLDRGGGQQQDEGQPGEQDVEGHLVRGLLPIGSLDEGDHPIDEAVARHRRDPDHDLIRQHPGATGHRAAVASRFTDDRRRLAGDGRLVDGRDPLDDIAVARDDLPGDHDAQVAQLQVGRPHLDEPLGSAHPGHRLRPRLAQGGGLGLPPPLGDRLGEVGEEHREPQPCGDQPGEPVVGRRARAEIAHEEHGREHAPDLHHEHDRVAGHVDGAELGEGALDGTAHEVAVEQRRPGRLRQGRLVARGLLQHCVAHGCLRSIVESVRARGARRWDQATAPGSR